MGRSRYKVYESTHPHFIKKLIKLIQSEAMMLERINYIHNNPIKRGYVDEAVHWRYSSARNYEGKEGLIDVERMW